MAGVIQKGDFEARPFAADLISEEAQEDFHRAFILKADLSIFGDRLRENLDFDPDHCCSSKGRMEKRNEGMC